MDIGDTVRYKGTDWLAVVVGFKEKRGNTIAIIDWLDWPEDFVERGSCSVDRLELVERDSCSVDRLELVSKGS